MGRLLDLPLELLELIVGHLHDDKASLGAFSLVSRALLRPSQAQLFKQINVRRIPAHGDGSSRNTEDMRKWTSLDPGDAQVLSYTRTLSLSSGQPLVYPQHLDDILGHLIAFKKVRNLTISLFATHYVRNPLVSPARYFAHFQPTLRSIYLTTCLTNPWDLITFIAFFPLLEDLTIQILDAYDLPALPESEPEGPEPAALSQFRGSLRLFQFRQTNAFVLELLKHRLQYRALSFSDVTIWTGIQELIVACAPTLQVLRFFNLGSECPFLPPTTKASVDRGCLVFWDFSGAESTLVSFAEPRPVHGAEGDQAVSDKSRNFVTDGTASRSLIVDIFTPPSMRHPHPQRQSFRQ